MAHTCLLPTRRNRRPARGGFTLIELIVAAALLSLLAMNVWMLMGTYRRLFESGKAKAEQTHLARSLLQQMADDFGSAIQDTQVTGVLSPEKKQTASSGSETVRRFGLFGTENELRFDVLALTAEQVFGLYYEDGDGEIDPTESFDEGEESARVPELRTIEYRFTPRPEIQDETDELETLAEEEEPADFSDDESDDGRVEYEPRPGLVRKEFVFDRPEQEEDDTSDSQPDRSDDLEENDSLDESESWEPLLPETTWLPEVVDMTFAYYSGQGWSDRWDSLKQKSLPVAIRVRVTFESFDPEDHRRLLFESDSFEDSTSDTEEGVESLDRLGTTDSDDPLAALETLDGVSDSVDEEKLGIPTRTYEIVIAMPVSAKYPGIRAGSTRGSKSSQTGPKRKSTEGKNAGRAGATGRPIPRPSRKSRSPAKADQWMRTEK